LRPTLEEEMLLRPSFEEQMLTEEVDRMIVLNNDLGWESSRQETIDYLSERIKTLRDSRLEPYNALREPRMSHYGEIVLTCSSSDLI